MAYVDDFARGLCKDLNLGGEYCATIAHSIREQLAWHNKAYLQGQFIEEELPTVQFPPLRELYKANTSSNRARNRLGISGVEDMEQWGPNITYLTEQDLEKMRVAKEREQRRLRRSTGGGGAASSGRRERRIRYR